MMRVYRTRRSSQLANNNDVDVPQRAIWGRISYPELVQATNGFNDSNLLGRGRLLDGMEIAAKVFHLQTERALGSFNVECEVLSGIRHRNLVKIISGCTNDDLKALVLEYMPNGSLEKGLYSDEYFLDILQRLNILIDVASALEYLHFGYSVPVVHCDIKPSNVLLDQSMVGHLSDFGITKLLGEEDSMTQTLATIDYIAPVKPNFPLRRIKRGTGKDSFTDPEMNGGVGVRLPVRGEPAGGRTVFCEDFRSKIYKGAMDIFNIAVQTGDKVVEVGECDVDHISLITLIHAIYHKLSGNCDAPTVDYHVWAQIWGVQ
ncbi:hypothetical protein Ddye_025729 [Dipteronia dyeriana]|uniref:Protein kinase domain-containing protein n=1 Tax=Dipteronia dyeriana TaxID=168575 RepID=A0AAD9WNH3_9ROSI|nr:hypothetical protein Ddye_025729 [Dipteronia dyeriana]